MTKRSAALSAATYSAASRSAAAWADRKLMELNAERLPTLVTPKRRPLLSRLLSFLF